MLRAIGHWVFLVTILSSCSRICGAEPVGIPGNPDRTHWVEVMRKLESDPLDLDINRQAAEVLKEIEEDHSIRVALCPSLLSDFNTMKYVYSHTITHQFMLASTAFLVENPDKTDSSNRDNRREKDLAALRSVLKTYRSILKTKPDAHQKSLDELLRQEDEGKLLDYVKKKCP